MGAGELIHLHLLDVPALIELFQSLYPNSYHRSCYMSHTETMSGTEPMDNPSFLMRKINETAFEDRSVPDGTFQLPLL
jgi:hypothetical protein